METVRSGSDMSIISFKNEVYQRARRITKTDILKTAIFCFSVIYIYILRFKNTDHVFVPVLLKQRDSKSRDDSSLDVEDVYPLILLREKLDVIISLNGELQRVSEQRETILLNTIARIIHNVLIHKVEI